MKLKVVVVFLMGIAIPYFYLKYWGNGIINSRFECQAKMHSTMASHICNGRSDFDIFLSIHNDGTGYYIVSGNYLCDGSQKKTVDNIVNFTYKKDGDNYSIKLDERNSDVTKMVKILIYDDIKLKVKKVDNFEYMMRLPFKQTMFCKKY